MSSIPTPRPTHGRHYCVIAHNSRCPQPCHLDASPRSPKPRLTLPRRILCPQPAYRENSCNHSVCVLISVKEVTARSCYIWTCTPSDGRDCFLYLLRPALSSSHTPRIQPHSPNGGRRPGAFSATILKCVGDVHRQRLQHCGGRGRPGRGDHRSVD